MRSSSFGMTEDAVLAILILCFIAFLGILVFVDREGEVDDDDT